ncbi:MAG: TrkA family potassium uptake protein [Methanomicrobiaceae archaeon]|nr:TrkA family potassium uptake protein [Methanomicrobiaceae archaeon]
MRVIIVGASALGTNLAQRLIKKGKEVILIERDEARAKELSETLDCTVINAEGTRPDILEKAEIDKADAIVACTEHDQNNILIALIARTMNVPEIIIRTEDIQFLAIAKKLGFRHVVNPPQTASVIISDALRGVDTIELSTLMRGDMRFRSVIVGSKMADKKLSEVTLPKGNAYIGIYRQEVFLLHTDDPALKEGDELLVVTVEESETDLCDIFCDIEENQG